MELAHLERARAPVAEHTRRTPLLRSEWLSERTGGDVWLKCENLQITGSFKARGAVAALSEMPEELRAAGVVSCSSGNHAQGLARAARLFGAPCTLVISCSTPVLKEERTLAFGARVVRAPSGGYDEAEAWALEHLEELGGTFVSAFDDPSVAAGNGGTVAEEILAVGGHFDAVLAPGGGGGLISGLGLALGAGSPGTRCIGVCAEGTPALARSRERGEAIPVLVGTSTLADALEGGVRTRSFGWVQEHVDELLVAPESLIAEAMVGLMTRDHLVAEGAGATAVAALLDGACEGERVCVVVSGGNVEPVLLARLLAETEA